MIEIALFFGLCFFGWGDCPEPIVEKKFVLEVDFFAYKGYDWEVTHSEFRQGIIGEVVDDLITFASGNYYFIKSSDKQLEAGQIITIKMDYFESSCELARVSLNNQTTYYNIKDKDSFELVKNDRYKTDDELHIIRSAFGWSDMVWWKYTGNPNPTEKCAGYEKYSLESIDGKLAEEIPVGFRNG